MTNAKCSSIPGDKRKVSKVPATPAHVPERICNLGYLITITRGNKERLNNLLAVFLEETPLELTALSGAIEKTNYTLICDILHKVKCSFSILGISSLTTPVNEMKDLSNIAFGIKKIKQLNQQVNFIFRQAIEEIKSETGTA